MTGNKFAHAGTKNVRAFYRGMDEASKPVGEVARFGLFHGPYSLGKTVAAKGYAKEKGIPYLRLTAADSPTSVLADALRLLGVEPTSARKKPMLNELCYRLTQLGQPIIFDEVEHLLNRGHKEIEILRDLLDVANVPIIMIGMEGINQKLQRLPWFVDRIKVNLEFQPFDAADIGEIAEQICGGVNFEREALEFILKKTKGKLRGVTTYLEQVNNIVKRNTSLKMITVSHLEKVK